MHLKTLALVAAAAFVLAPSLALGAGQCCGDGKACCKEIAACCRSDGNNAAASVLLPQADVLMDLVLPEADVAGEPIRQTAEVYFMKPVWAGEFILQGHYIIEHDMLRMAKGRPCTHIYAANKPQVPVVRFHCTHLERAKAEHNTVVLQRTHDPLIPWKLEAFQFAGETAAHGVPAER